MFDHPAEVSQLQNWGGAQSIPSLLTHTASLGGVRESRQGGARGRNHGKEKFESPRVANKSRQMAFWGENN